MSDSVRETPREGSLEAPTRHPLDWQSPEFGDEPALFAELERVFDICHGCRRCFSLCQAFPTLFDAIDASDTMELDGVDRSEFWNVVDQCYLCDMCYMTKCPYVPPHEWNVDFPHLMLRAKAVKFRKGDYRMRDRLLSATDVVGRIAGIPVIAQAVNAANRSRPLRALLDKALGVHPDAHVPAYHSDTLRRRMKRAGSGEAGEPVAGGDTRGRVVLFTTCYGNRNDPALGEDLVRIFRHNGIPVTLLDEERCCGMPKLEIGDLDAVRRARDFNIPRLARMVDDGWDIVAPVPSCVLMLKQEYPLLFPDDEEVRKVARATRDPFEYLMLRQRAGLLRTDFTQPLGRVVYHVPCHLRVQNIGLRTRDVLQLVPDTEVEVVERCSGHDGTYGVKRETFDAAMKIGRPVVRRVRESAPDHYASDCPIAGQHIANGLADGSGPTHPLRLLCIAYGIA